MHSACWAWLNRLGGERAGAFQFSTPRDKLGVTAEVLPLREMSSPLPSRYRSSLEPEDTFKTWGIPAHGREYTIRVYESSRHDFSYEILEDGAIRVGRTRSCAGEDETILVHRLVDYIVTKLG